MAGRRHDSLLGGLARPTGACKTCMLSAMDVGALSEAVMVRGAEVTLTLGEVALDELLLTVHTGRFTGAVRVGEPPESDRLCFRDGAFVGMKPRPSADARGFTETLLALRMLTPETLSALSDDGTREPRSLAKSLVEQRLLEERDLRRAIEEHTRRRLFALYDLTRPTPIRIREGIEHVAGFWPVPIDVRPIVAFGMVVRADPERRSGMLAKVRGRTARIVTPYDERRNSYGLPPPVVAALRSLERGHRMEGDMALPGLSSAETAGLLLLLDRMALLQVD